MVSEPLFSLSVPPLRGCEAGLAPRSERRYALASRRGIRESSPESPKVTAGFYADFFPSLPDFPGSSAAYETCRRAATPQVSSSGLAC